MAENKVRCAKQVNFGMTPLLPQIPNFIRFDNGVQNSICISIAKLSDEALGFIADEWKKELINTAQKKRELFKKLTS